MAEQVGKFELTRAVLALVRLAQLDLRAVDLFDKTPETAQRALRFVLYCVPAVMVLAWWDSGEYVKNTGNSALSYVLLAAEQMVISAFGFMLVIHHLGKKLGCLPRFAHYVTVECTLAVPVSLLVVLLTGLWRAADVSPGSQQFLEVLVYAVQIIIDWAVTYATLQLRPAAAFGICIMSVLFGMVIRLFMTLFFYLSLGPATGLLTP